MRTSNIALQRLLLILTLIVISSTVVLLLIEKKPMINRSSHDQDQPPDALFIEVNSDGLYKISLSDLQDQGLGIDNLDPETVRLTNQGAEIPYYIVEDNLVFLGQSSPSRYTNTNSYLLELNKSGKIIEEKIVSANSGPINERINNELRLENNLFYDGKLINQLKQSNRINEPWFWSTIHVGGSFLVEVDIPNLSTGAGELRIALAGVSRDDQVDNDHDLDILVNKRAIGNLTWDGESYHIGTLQIPDGILNNSANTIMIDNSSPGSAAIDISRLDWIDLAYPTTPEASDGSLKITHARGHYELTGFRSEPLILDAADPANPLILTGWDYKDGKVAVSITEEAELWAAEISALLEPDRIRLVKNSTLISDDSPADLIIITTEELAPALDPLITARINQGLNVRVATTDEIIDAFGQGQDSPEAIQAFLRHAYNMWQKPTPRYLLLVGEATYDYRNYLGEKESNIVTSPMISVTFSGETVSDARLADIDYDQIPDYAVGRWPVSEYNEVEDLVRRTLSYEGEIVGDLAVFIADGTDAEFSALNDSIGQQSQIETSSILQLAGSNPTDLVTLWKQGPWVVTYTGHGSLDRWGKQGIFSNDNADELKSEFAPPILIQLTCLTGLFAHPTMDSLSEALIKQKTGPVLVIGASSLTLSSSQEPFAVSLLQELDDPAVLRIGDALQSAKLALKVEGNPALQEINDTFLLFGDPSTLINRPPNF